MKKKFKFIYSWIILSVMVLSQLFGNYQIVKAQQTYILDDAFVSNFSGQANAVMVGSKVDKLILGKGRHAYIKFDLSSINISEVENIVLNITKSHAVNTLLFNESSDYLRNVTTQKDSSEFWTNSNINYNNRPLDLVGGKQYSLDMVNGEIAIKIDLMELFKDAINRGKKSVTVHFTTEAVDNSAIAASEMYSIRSTKILFI